MSRYYFNFTRPRGKSARRAAALFLAALYFTISPAVHNRLNAQNGPASGAQLSPADDRFYDGYTAWLQQHVSADGMVDYAAMAADRQPLIRFLISLKDTRPAELKSGGEAAVKAFYINAYNAVTIDIILRNYPLRKNTGFFRHPINFFRFPGNSIRQIPGVFDEIRYPVADRSLTLDDIEHGTLRSRFTDARLHAALVCAAKSCPPLMAGAFVPSQLDSQLESRMQAFVARSGAFSCSVTDEKLRVSKIFEWYIEDLKKAYILRNSAQAATDKEAVIDFVSPYVQASDKNCLASPALELEFSKYNWELNGK